MDLTALGFEADAPYEFKLWISAGDPVFRHMGRTVAYRLEAHQGRQPMEGKAAFEDVRSSQGAILQFLTEDLVPSLPPGSTLRVFTREANVSDPYELGRLQTWKASGKIKEKADWLRLEEAQERHGVEVRACRPRAGSADLEVLMTLTDVAKGVRPKRQPHPGDPVDHGGFSNPPFDADQARERAIAKDRKK